MKTNNPFQFDGAKISWFATFYEGDEGLLDNRNLLIILVKCLYCWLKGMKLFLENHNLKRGNLIRRQMLYPAELRDLILLFTGLSIILTNCYAKVF